MFKLLKKVLYPLFAALTMLTRFYLPQLKRINYGESDITNSTIYFPVIGLAFGIILYYGNALLSLLLVPVYFKAGVILAIPFMINKFFHFDGLCDLLDGFLADKTGEERLRIMKDPSIGSFALGGAILFFLFKYLGLYSLLSKNEMLIYLIIIPVYSRFIMVLLSFKSKYPREKGTASLIVGKISTIKFIAACLTFILTIAGFLCLAGWNLFNRNLRIILIAAFATIAFYLAFKFYSYKKIGGITGDVLGAACEIEELILIYSFIINNWILK